MSQVQHGKDAFIQYYSTLFDIPTEGANADFFTTLEQKRAPILRFAEHNRTVIEQLWQQHNLSWQTLSWFPTALLWPAEVPFGDMVPGVEEKLLYPMNASSLIPVLALNPQAGDTILDCCAAPGGKALALLDSTSGKIQLTVNDTSPKRRGRMRALLEQYGYPHESDALAVTGSNAATLFKRGTQYDRILADVPCSSERHVFTSEKHLDEWSPKRIKQLAQRQLAIASGVFEALKPGGRMVYATCAVNTTENEALVGKLLKKKKDRIQLLPWSVDCPRLPGMSATEKAYASEFNLEHVARILPHRMAESARAQKGIREKQEAQLMDPMFVAVFEKLA